MTISADIDGRSILHIDGHNAYWVHQTQAAPGRHLGGNAPTQIGTKSWLPTWPEPGENRDCGGCKSDVFHHVTPALPKKGPITFSAVSCREKCSGSAGGGQATIVFDDDATPGDAVYVATLTFYVPIPPASLAVEVSTAPKVAAGGMVDVKAKVTAENGPVSSISLGKGLVTSNDDAIVSSSPTGLSGFSLAKNASRSFTFKVKGAKEGISTLSLTAAGKAGSKAVEATGHTELKVIQPGIVVNTVSDSSIDPRALSDDPPLCEIDTKAVKPECSLRAAIELVNKLGGQQKITFDIPGGGVPQIEPKTVLPGVTANTTIDGTSQPGGWVELSGDKAPKSNGLELDGGSSKVRGLVVNGFADGVGILINNGAGDVIAGDRVGSDPAGEAAAPNRIGVEVDAPAATIGGTNGTKPDTCAGDCDLLSGNSASEVVFGAGSSGRVIGDTIGPDLGGEKVLKWLTSAGSDGEHVYGLISVGTSRYGAGGPSGAVLVGGATSAPGAAPGNLIAGGQLGVEFVSEAGGVMAGNLVGLDRAGNRSLEGNVEKESANFSGSAFPSPRTPGSAAFSSGVLAMVHTTIGGLLAADSNVISGFPHGVLLLGRYDEAAHEYVTAGGDLIEHDLIGTNAAGTEAIGNFDGVDGVRGNGTVVDSVVSGNFETGIVKVEAVRGSRIGTNATGTAAIPNKQFGIAGVATVGGLRSDLSCSDPCNLISGNGEGGVVGSDRVEGNFIGTDLAGTSALPNGTYWETADGRAELKSGVVETSEAAVVLGGSAGGRTSAMSAVLAFAHTRDGSRITLSSTVCDGACNLISGNDEPGVVFDGRGSSLQGNVIGLSASGLPLPNHGAGVEMPFASGGGTIGGAGDDGNVIVDNLGPGIELLGRDRSVNQLAKPVASIITGNAITGNTSGISYAQGTVAPEAPDDIHWKHDVTNTDPHLEISGKIPDFFKGTSSSRRIDIYGGSTCEAGPQGLVPVASFTSGSSSPSFEYVVLVNPDLHYFTVTDTYEGSTSTFSKCSN